mmetsp:Transcript_9638/g.16667  ORF Transcript_9638/g.16667 Transcript_9638/m.16667 type:complete len:246 (-) Transcript_9638:659-1396(-)|eukprot:CAMPEP_0196658266 /NCGR_PEP_ID=MMETSP1086-20130531/28510_1 /TAXON_ID=77921 /ORGANISM="Cyanoptyche  gloeocystis , Strain SAG4.97" /LENGTH=245 /DNA_ID=CAMNT_0041991753 /DNA_START=89 /DNA_END=826 /DNA_ORIENTATION=+
MSSRFAFCLRCCEGNPGKGSGASSAQTPSKVRPEGSGKPGAQTLSVVTGNDPSHQPSADVVGKLWQIAKTTGPPVPSDKILGKLHACVYEVQLRPLDSKTGSKKGVQAQGSPIIKAANASRTPEPKTFVRLALGEQQARTQSRTAESYAASNVRRLVNYHELVELEVSKGHQPQLSVHVYDEPVSGSGEKAWLVGKVQLDVQDLVEANGMGTNLFPLYVDGENTGHILIRMWYHPAPLDSSNPPS